MWQWKNCYWISILIFCDLFWMLRTAQLLCFKESLSDYTRVSLEDPLKLFKLDCYNNSLPTVFYTFGYRGKVRGPATTAVLTAYLNARRTNTILLDWEEEARTGIIGLPLSYVLHALPNAKLVGRQLGDALVTLANAGMDMSKVHLMGHSLGAHVMGHAGRWTRGKGCTVARITGLDPARVLFEGNYVIQRGLDRSCGKQVVIIHTNPGNYGSNMSTGTVDLWPNYNTQGIQPGCPTGSFTMFSAEDLCNHDRSWQYYVETIQTGVGFAASAADSYESWLTQDKNSNQTIIYVGEEITKGASGNYYCTTNGKSPFNKGEDGAIFSKNTKQATVGIKNSAYKKVTMKKYFTGSNVAERTTDEYPSSIIVEEILPRLRLINTGETHLNSIASKRPTHGYVSL